jgi:hypothetical protein
MSRRRIAEGGAILCFFSLLAAIPAGFLCGRCAVFVTAALLALGVTAWVAFDREPRPPQRREATVDRHQGGMP